MIYTLITATQTLGGGGRYRKTWPLKMGPSGSPEIPVSYHFMPSNNPQDGRFQKRKYNLNSSFVTTVGWTALVESVWYPTHWYVSSSLRNATECILRLFQGLILPLLTGTVTNRQKEISREFVGSKVFCWCLFCQNPFYYSNTFINHMTRKVKKFNPFKTCFCSRNLKCSFLWCFHNLR